MPDTHSGVVGDPHNSAGRGAHFLGAAPAHPRTTEVIGNRRSHLYHKATCRGAARTAEKDRVRFDSAQQAEAAGYRQAGDCW